MFNDIVVSGSCWCGGYDGGEGFRRSKCGDAFKWAFISGQAGIFLVLLFVVVGFYTFISVHFFRDIGVGSSDIIRFYYYSDLSEFITLLLLLVLDSGFAAMFFYSRFSLETTDEAHLGFFGFSAILVFLF